MARRRYTPKLKAQVVLEVLEGDKTPGRGRGNRRFPKRWPRRPRGLPPPYGTALDSIPGRSEGLGRNAPWRPSWRPARGARTSPTRHPR